MGDKIRLKSKDLKLVFDSPYYMNGSECFNKLLNILRFQNCGQLMFCLKGTVKVK